MLPDDVDENVVFGASYIGEHALLSANYFQGNLKDDLDTGESGSTKIILLEGDYLWRFPNPSWYCGLGFGISAADTTMSDGDPGGIGPGSKRSTDGIGNALLGWELNGPGKPGPFIEGRYRHFNHIQLDADDNGEINGWTAQVGWKF
jgi:hypothetical protein